MLIDTHTHLYSSKFSEDRPAMIERARAAGVELALLPAVDSQSHDRMIALEAAYPDFCIAMIGLHPVSVKDNYEEELAIVKSWLDRREWIAIGEIGLDFYWDKTFVAQQEDAFLRQCAWAIEYDLPIVIHARDSIDRLLELLEALGDKCPRGEFHCWTGDHKQSTRALDLGFYLGIGGIVTFKNGGLDKVVPELPKDRILLETDSPYLAPVPHRGKRNETAYVLDVAKKISEIWNCPLETVKQQTGQNARQLFEIDRFKQQALS